MSIRISSFYLPGRPTFASEWRAFWAIFRRSWIIFRRYPSWVISMVVWPILFPVMYVIGAQAMAGPDGSGLAAFQQVSGFQDYKGFIAIGTIVWMWQNMVLWDVGFSLRDEQLQGTLESSWVSPTWRFSFLLGHSLVAMVTMLVLVVVSIIEFALVFGMDLNINPLPAFLVLLVGIPSIYGLGFVFASLVITVKEANAFVFLVRGLVMIFCGITFPVLILPGWMQTVASLLPPTYIIHGMRLTILSGADISAVLPDLGMLAVYGVFWLGLGYLLFNWMERRARQTGAIGQY